MTDRKFGKLSPIYKFISCVVLACILFLGPGSRVSGNILYAQEPEASSAADAGADMEQENIVIVIDPGHGGENLGGEYEDYTEKEMTIVVARAMKEELEKYDGITVYLTRTGDQELSLEERCAYAESVNADFLFCLHFNLSEYHTLFGAECWVSAYGENYSKGYSFASIEIDMLQELGLYSRGIKTRLNKKGIDYYGIIRHATERDIPCVLIEHCHLDQENDKPFYDHDEKLKEFGKLDATAVAKYFRLHSEELGVDYSDYQNVNVAVPSHVVAPDKTEPDICMIDVLDQNMENGEVTVQVSAADYDSGMLYYAYSYDNGMNFSQLQRWPDRSQDTFSFTLHVPPHIVPQIVVNGYNGYDLYTTSNMISLPSMDYKTTAEIVTELSQQKILATASNTVSSRARSLRVKQNYSGEEETTVSVQKPISFTYFMAVCGVCALLVLAMVVSIILILRSRKRRRRRRRRR